MDPTALMAYLAAATALIVLPGPDWAFVLAVGTRERLVLPAAAGLGTGYVLMAVGVAAGLAPLVAAAPAALVVIAVAGAAYLVYLGVGIVRSAGDAASLAATMPANSGNVGRAGTSQAMRLLRRGIGVSALNPKSLVLFVAFLPQFVRTSAPWPVVVQLAVLGLAWAAIGAVFYAILGVTARKALGSRPHRASILGRVTGVAMIVGGIALASEQLLHALG